MKLTKIIEYRTKDGRRVVRFCPLQPKGGIPGFTHRVIIDGLACDWLGDHQTPCEKTALYFLGKHTRPTSA